MGVLAFTPACVTGGQYGYGRQSIDYRELDRRAYDNGFRSGVSNGERDARDRRDFRVDRDRDYRAADDGFYHQGAYSREQYQRMFRSGYEAGYTEGYSRLSRSYGGRRGVTPGVVIPPTRPNSTGGGYYASPAARNGYDDGLEAGRNDARDHRSFDPVRARRYREGDRGYTSRDGSRDDYKREYRAAFQQGYEQGYRRY